MGDEGHGFRNSSACNVVLTRHVSPHAHFPDATHDALERNAAPPAQPLHPSFPGGDSRVYPPWLVMRTAMLNSSESFLSRFIICPNFCWRSASSPPAGSNGRGLERCGDVQMPVEDAHIAERLVGEPKGGPMHPARRRILSAFVPPAQAHKETRVLLGRSPPLQTPTIHALPHARPE